MRTLQRRTVAIHGDRNASLLAEEPIAAIHQRRQLRQQ